MNSKSDLIFGIRALIEAIKSGKEIEKIFIKKGLQGELSQELMDLVKKSNLPYQLVPLEKINRISRKNHQGVIAFISQIEYQPIEEIIPVLYEQGQVPLILILDGVTDVRNLGAIGRTAECAGVHAILLPVKGSAQINADTIKTSAGALHSLPVCRSNNLRKSILFLKESGLQIIAASEKAGEFYYNADYKRPTAIILGSEDKGISLEYIRLADKIVKIPVLGKIASLNVSVAGSVILYEAVRQKLVNPQEGGF